MIGKKKKEIQNNECTPIFPIYLDTLRIKDTIAIICDGTARLSLVTKDVTNQMGRETKIKVSGNLYKVSGEGGNTNKTGTTNHHSEQYEKEHTDASLFYKLLQEFKTNNRIKTIEKKEDIVNSKEGDVVLFEGNIYGNEIRSMFNKLIASIEFFSVFDKSGKLKEYNEQLNDINNRISNSTTISDTMNMICKINDENELLLVLDTKNLIGDTGVELAHGKFKILGVVYEKINEGEVISLARDSMLGMLKDKEINEFYKKLNEEIDNKLNIPQVKNELIGPTLGVLPIGIYL